MKQEQIRRATQADVPVLVEFNVALALETEGLRLSPQVVQAGISEVLGNSSRGFYLVSEVDAVVVGAMMITSEWSDWRNGNFWWLQSVFVRPEHRGRGVFRRLYGYALELAREDASACGFRLYVEQDNQAAQRTYASLGMRRTHYIVYEALKCLNLGSWSAAPVPGDDRSAETQQN